MTYVETATASRSWFDAHGVDAVHYGCGARLLPDFLNLDACNVSRVIPATDDAAPGIQRFAGNLACVVEREDGVWPVALSLPRPAYFLRHDARDALPVESGSAERIFAEHFLEHLGPTDGIAWLAAMRTLLRPGGVLRLSTPDLERYAAAHAGADSGFRAAHLDELEAHGLPVERRSRGWFVNQVFKSYFHKWIYDFDEVLHAATRAGFSRSAIERVAYREGRDPWLASHDQEWRRAESLYVELRST